MSRDILSFNNVLRFKIFLKVSVALFFILSSISCKKFLTVDSPKNLITTQTAFQDDGTAISAVVGIYSQMMSTGSFADGSLSSITFLGGVSSDELIDYSFNSPQGEFFQNTISPTNSSNLSLWSSLYQFIYTSNSIAEALNSSNKITEETRVQLLGEVRFIRAFCYFYLVNLFGDIPLVVSTDYNANSNLPRIDKGLVYKQIIEDLNEAKNALSSSYVGGDNMPVSERIRPNKWAATALLSRVYLFTEDWSNAEFESSTLIDNSDDYELVNDLDKVFLKDSKEAIWQLMPVRPGVNTNEAQIFVLNFTPYNTALRDHFAIDFEAGDNRRIKWVGQFDDGSQIYYFPNKYKVQYGSPAVEYSVVFRLAEQFLIRAEARANLNEFEASVDDINAIRIRAGLPAVHGSTKEELLEIIEGERKSEMFTEWGHRWLDLKRFKGVVDPSKSLADEVLSEIKQAWQPTAILFPIPKLQIQNSPNVIQNPGYN